LTPKFIFQSKDVWCSHSPLHPYNRECIRS
jgi:hypothetical protein